ncbi:DinB family protein [Humisphaera borealis]|uniref:DinB family protein n=1 Tax=Humisphaera borealis TaxID=2807512 RepID=A0A7M2WR66_9BACT|nr:DinB family protein [Humisphaera borealis]QOV87734.1 DinB family protein [Humisphaera borealis]
MHDASLIMLANEVRGKTLRVLTGVTEEQARFTGHAALNNSILWHAGHALWVVEKLGVIPATGEQARYPADWSPIFAAGGTPATVTNWPSLSAVVSALQEQLTRLTAVLSDMRTERLDQVIDADRNRTLRYSILHGLHDEACHCGEIQLLKKLIAKG